MDTRFLLSFPD